MSSPERLSSPARLSSSECPPQHKPRLCPADFSAWSRQRYCRRLSAVKLRRLHSLPSFAFVGLWAMSPYHYGYQMASFMPSPMTHWSPPLCGPPVERTSESRDLASPASSVTLAPNETGRLDVLTRGHLTFPSSKVLYNKDFGFQVLTRAIVVWPDTAL